MKKILLLAHAILLIACVYALSFRTSSPKIAYVRSAVLIDRFAGVKEARQLYEEKLLSWKSNVDTLEKRLDQSLEEYEKSKDTYTPRELQLRQTSLAKQKTDLQNYKNTIYQIAQKEESARMQGALNQINSFLEEYAKENGYAMILGTTQTGSLLYGSEALDITEEIIEQLNKTHVE